MKTRMKKVVGIALLGTLAVAAGPVLAQRPDIGKAEFLSKCAICHGQSGRGDGGVTELLKVAPANLTVLKKNNDGVFPFERVFSVIDGRTVVKGHGDRDMPIWGERYSREQAPAAQYYMDVPFHMEMFVQARILALIDYLNRIQAP